MMRNNGDIMDSNNAINILLVEDNDDDAFLIAESLDERFQLTRISDGQEAFEYLQKTEEPHDVVLVDFHLPSMDGLEILSGLKEKSKEFAFIVLTVDERIDTAINAMKAGALDFLPKFRGFDELPDMICKIHDIHKERLEKKKIEIELQKSEELWRSITENSPDIIITLDTDLKVLFCNKIIAQDLAYEDLIGTPIYNYVAEERKTEIKEILYHVLKSSETATYETEYENPDGSIIYFETRAVSRTLNKEVTGLTLHTRVITDSKNSEEKLKASLAEKEVLLREIHHRVKNNMQVISSMLKLQARQIDDKTYADIFHESVNRIYSMSLIHSMLYQTENFSEIDFQHYIRKISHNISNVFQSTRNRVTIRIDAEKIFLNLDTAIPCGLIVNELVTNSYKHAYPDNRAGEIRISFRAVGDDKTELIVSDNGVGLPEDMDWENSETLGLKIVGLLTKQIHGDIKHLKTGGAMFIITFGRRSR